MNQNCKYREITRSLRKKNYYYYKKNTMNLRLKWKKQKVNLENVWLILTKKLE